MADNEGSVFGTLTLLISDIAMLDAAFMIFGTKGGRATLSIGVWPWLMLATASFALFRLFLRRERKLPHSVAFLAGAYVATVAVLFVFFVDLPSLLSTIVAALFWTVPLWRIYFLTATPPAFEKLTMRLDIIIFVLLFVLLYIVGTGGTYARALPCVISLFLCLASLIIMRAAESGVNKGGKIRGASVMLTFLLLIGAAITVFILFASASLGDAIASGAAALLYEIKRFFELLGRFLVWLVSFLPAPDHSAGSPLDTMAPPAFEAQGEADIIYAGPTAFMVIVCAFAALVLVFLIIAVVRYRGSSLGGKRLKKATAIKRRSPRARESFLRQLISRVRFFGYSILYRNTPQGVFVWLERWGRAHRRGRSQSETQRKYLMRLFADIPQHEAALLDLADALDARWYGDPSLSQLSRHELIKLRRKLTRGRFPC